jgi:cyanase
VHTLTQWPSKVSKNYHTDRTTKARFVDHITSHRPLIYRFYELVQTYGTTWKALIEEEFGDGIMSAIDFEMQIKREPSPKGDRVKIGMSDKFLPTNVLGAGAYSTFQVDLRAQASS